jgi:hypothetical protein
MAIIENKWILIALVVLCWALAASFMAGYYCYQYSDLAAKTRGRTFFANLGIKHDNGSAIVWFNGTKINAGSTLLDFTRLLVSVNYTESLSGASVSALDGVPNSYPKWWMWWSWSSYGWNFGPIACDRYIIGENETVLWYYQDISVYPPPPP